MFQRKGFYKELFHIVLQARQKNCFELLWVLCRMWQGYSLTFDMFIINILSFPYPVWTERDKFIRDG